VLFFSNYYTSSIELGQKHTLGKQLNEDLTGKKYVLLYSN